MFLSPWAPAVEGGKSRHPQPPTPRFFSFYLSIYGCFCNFLWRAFFGLTLSHPSYKIYAGAHVSYYIGYMSFTKAKQSLSIVDTIGNITINLFPYARIHMRLPDWP